MASRFASEKIEGVDGIRLPPMHQKSKIPVRKTGSDSEKSSSSEDETEKKWKISREFTSVDKLGNKRPSRIPVLAEQQKTIVEKEQLQKKITPADEQRPTERFSGNQRGKPSAVKKGPCPPLSTKQHEYKISEESIKNATPKMPRRLVPLEKKKVAKSTTVPRRNSRIPRDTKDYASDSSSTERTDDVTPDFECNITREEVDLIVSPEVTMSGNDFRDDFERQSTSSDERDMPNVPPWLRDAVKERKQKELCEQQQSADEKKSRDDITGSDSSSDQRTDDVTPELECNIDREDADVLISAEATISGDDFEDDFQRHSTSSDEREMPNVPPWLRNAVKEKKQKIEEQQQKVDEKKPTQTEVEADAAEVTVEDTMSSFKADSTPQDICSDFVAEELAKIVEQMSSMNADMTEDEHADAMPSLLLLRDEAREREVATKVENRFGDDGIKKESEQLIEERSDIDNADAVSDEELDCNTSSLDSEGKRAIAKFDERLKMRKAEFDEENKVVIDRIENIKEQFGTQQEKDLTCDQEIDDIKMKCDKLQEDMRRLDEVTRRRECEEIKWRKKMDKKMKKNARKLERARSQRRLYQEGVEAQEAGQPEVQNNDAALDAESSTTQQYDRVPKETKNASRESLFDSAEVTDYNSVEQLEKKRKELRRFEKLEREAVKREKLERKERKKIAKEKRKVERKLEKLGTKECAVAEDLEVSKCVSMEPPGTCSSTVEIDGSNQLLDGDENEQYNDQCTGTSEAEEKTNNASNKASEDDAALEESSQPDVIDNHQTSQTCHIGKDELRTARALLPQVLDNEILSEDLSHYLDPQVQTESGHQRPLESEDNFLGRNDGSPYVLPILDESNSMESIVNDDSDVQQSFSLDSPAMMDEKSAINYTGKEITEDLTSVEEDIDMSSSKSETKSDGDDENSPVFNKPAPLVRKQSGRFVLHGLTPCFHSPGNPIDKGIQENTDSSVEGLEECEPLFEKRLALLDDEEGREHLVTSSDCVLEDIDEMPVAENSEYGDMEAHEHLAASSDCALEELDEVSIPDNIEYGYKESREHLATSSDCLLEDLDEVPTAANGEKDEEEEVQFQFRSQLYNVNVRAVTEKTQKTLLQSSSQSPYVILPEPDTEGDTEDDFSDQLFATFAHHEDESIHPKAGSHVKQKLDATSSVGRDDELSLCKDDLSELYPKEVDSAENLDGFQTENTQTDDVEVSAIHDEGLDYVEDVIHEGEIDSSDNMQTEDIEISAIHGEDIDYLEEFEPWDKLETDDIEMSGVGYEDLDYVEDAIYEDSVQIANMMVCGLGSVDKTCCWNEKNEAISSEQEQSSPVYDVSPSNRKELKEPPNIHSWEASPILARSKGVYSPVSPDDTREKEFIDEFDDLLDQVEEDMKLKDSLSDSSHCEMQKHNSHDGLCSVSYHEHLEKPATVDENAMENIPETDASPHAILQSITASPSVCEESRPLYPDSDVVDEKLTKNEGTNAFCIQDDEDHETTEEAEDFDSSWESLFDLRPGSCDDNDHSDVSAYVDGSDSFGQLRLSLEEIQHCSSSFAEDKTSFASGGQDNAFSTCNESTLRGKEKEQSGKYDEDKFIADFDFFLDEVEDDIRIEESKASESNPQSLTSNREPGKSADDSRAYTDEESSQGSSVSDMSFQESSLSSCERKLPDITEEDEGDDPVQDSFLSVSELISEKSTLSSCDHEVADINNSTLSVLSEDEDDDPDSWFALDDITLPCCRSGKCISCSNVSDSQKQFDDRLLEQRDTRREESIAAVVNISEYLLQEELLHAFKVATLETKKFIIRNAEHRVDEIDLSHEALSKCQLETSKGKEEFRKENSEISDELDTLRQEKTKLQTSLKDAEEKNQALKEIVDFTNKENEKLLDQVIALKEEEKAHKKDKQSWQSELETVTREVQRLKTREEYRERELTNLREDIENKEQRLADMDDELNYAKMDKEDVMYDIETLEEKLRESEESNEELNFQVDELKIMMKELKNTGNAQNDRHDYGYLREEVELLKGSLVLSKRQEKHLKCQLDGLEEILKTSKYKDEQVIRGYKQQIVCLAEENSRIKIELSEMTSNENDKQLRELKDEQAMIMNQLREQLATVQNDNSRLNAEANEEKLKVSDNDRKVRELKEENARVIDQLHRELISLQDEKVKMTAEPSKVSNKENYLIEPRDEKARIIAQFQKQLAKFENEKSKMVAKLSNMSRCETQLKELLEEVENLRNQNKHLQDETLEAKEQSAKNMITSVAESSEKSRSSKKKLKKNKHEIRKLKKTIHKNEREIAVLESFIRQRGLNTMDTTGWFTYQVKLRKEIEKELQSIKQRLQHREKELDQTKNALMFVTGTAKAIKERVEAMEDCMDDFFENSNTNDMDASLLPDDSCHDNLNDSENLEISLNEEPRAEELKLDEEEGKEINRDKEDQDKSDRLSLIVEEEARATVLSVIEEEKIGATGLCTIKEEEAGATGRSVLKQKEAGATGIPIIVDEEATAKGLSVANEEEIVDTALPIIVEGEAGATGIPIIVEDEVGATVLFIVKEGKDELAINNEQDEDASKAHDIGIENGTRTKEPNIHEEAEGGRKVYPEKEVGNERLVINKDVDDGAEGRFSKDEENRSKGLATNKEEEAKDNVLSINMKEEHNGGALAITTEEGVNAGGLVINTEDGGNAMESQLAHLNQILRDSVEDIQHLTTTLWQRRELWKQSRWYGSKEEAQWLRNQLNAKELEMRCLTDESIEIMANLDATIKGFEGELEGARSLLTEKTDTLEQTEAKLQLQESQLANTEVKHEDTVKQLQGDLESTRISLKEKEAALERTEEMLQLQTSLFVNREEKHNDTINQLQGDFERVKTSLRETTDTLEQTEANLESQTSRLAFAEAKHQDIVKHLLGDLESMEILLKEKSDALEQTEAKLTSHTSLLASTEAKHKVAIEQLQEELESMGISLKEKSEALEKTGTKLQKETLAHGSVEKKYGDIMKQLQGEVECMQTVLKEKTEDSLNTEMKLRAQTSALDSEKRMHDDIVKQLQGDITRMQGLLEEKAQASDETERKLKLLLANKEAKHEEVVKHLQKELKSTQISLMEKTETLELHLKTSSHLAVTEAEHEGTVKQLQRDLESKVDLLKETELALEQTEAKVQAQMSRLATVEAKHKENIKELKEKLKNAQNALKEKQDALEKTEADLRFQQSLLSNLRDNKHEELRTKEKEDHLEVESTITRLKEDLEKSQNSLKEKTSALEQTQVALQLKTSLLAGANSNHEHIVKRLEGDLHKMKNALQEKEEALEKVEFDLQLKSSLVASLQANVSLRESEFEDLKLTYKGRELELERVTGSLNDLKKVAEISDIFLVEQTEELVSLKTSFNWKNRAMEKMRFAVEPTQNELKLLSAELVCAKNEKERLLRDVTAATARLEEEKITNNRERKILQEQMNAAWEELKVKTKEIWDLKTNLKESRIWISILESEKRELEEQERDYKEKVAGEIKWLKQALKASEGTNKSLLSTIASAKQDNFELKRKNQRLKIEVLQKEMSPGDKDVPSRKIELLLKEVRPADDGDVPSRPLMWAVLDARRQETLEKIKTLSSEITTELAHGPLSNEQICRQKSKECFSLRELEAVNRKTVLSASNVTLRDWASLKKC